MNAVAMVVLLVLLPSGVTAAAGETPGQTPDYVRDYSARRHPDGSVALVVTGTAAVPDVGAEVNLQLAPMLEAAAARECPSGYDLTADAAPVVRTERGRLVATLGGVAQCK